MDRGSLEAFRALCDSFFPSIPNWKDKLSQVDSVVDLHDRPADVLTKFMETSAGKQEDLVTECLSLMERLLTAHQQQSVRVVLFLLSKGWGTALLSVGRYTRSFANLSARDREQFVIQWMQSPITAKRVLCRTIRLIVMMAVFGHVNDSGVNEFWPLCKYPDPKDSITKLSPAIKPLPLNFIDSSSSAEVVKLTYDAVVIGSGAGGGVIAAQLAKAGYRVLIIEKGSMNRSPNLDLTELKCFDKMYENRGFTVTSDGSISIISGSTLGGGTTINWSASLAPPYYVREQWARDFGLDHFLTDQFQESVDRVMKRIGVSTENVVHNMANSILLGGCEKLGYPCQTIPQNSAAKEHQCSYCAMGCPSATKQGTMETYLVDACKNGAEIMCNSRVDRIVWDRESKLAQCVEGRYKVGNNDIVNFSVTAKLIVSSCGSLHTPALLLRSGFKNSNIGRHLKLHPVSVVSGYFPGKDINMWQGASTTALSSVGDNPDGNHYGAKIEVPFAHPAIAAAIPPMVNASKSELEFKECETPTGLYSKLRLLRFPNICPLFVLQRDRDSKAHVTLDIDGNPAVEFKLGTLDRISMQNALKRTCNILLSQGATEIATSIENHEPYRVKSGSTSSNKGILEPSYQRFVDEIDKMGLYPTFNCSLFSAHQMSSCRMASTGTQGACNPQGQLWECENVFVCDASVLPTGSGVNPMVTIMSCADMISQHAVAYLKETHK